jgi:hypothetical protein
MLLVAIETRVALQADDTPRCYRRLATLRLRDQLSGGHDKATVVTARQGVTVGQVIAA